MAVPNLLTVAEVATAMGKGIDTVLGMIHSGELKASNISRSSNRPSWRIHPDDYAAYLESRSNQQTPKPTKARRSSKPRREYV